VSSAWVEVTGLTVWRDDEEMKQIWQRQDAFHSLFIINDDQPMSLTVTTITLTSNEVSKKTHPRTKHEVDRMTD